MTYKEHTWIPEVSVGVWVQVRDKPKMSNSKTDTEKVLRLILRLSLLIRYRVFRVHAHAFS